MADSALQVPILVCLAVLITAVVSGLLPVSPVEVVLLAVAASVPPALVFPLTLLATLGHMAAKTVVYVGSRRTAPTIPARHQAAVQRVRTLLMRRRRMRIATVLVSAAGGVPPFYLVTICCGALRLPLRDYLLAGTIGRGLRFAALAVIPRFAGPV
jgi:membrane protein YqaA with SNARE-associated domain